MKKVIALALALVLAIGVLAACGGTGDNGDDNKMLGMSESPLPAPEITKDYEIKEDFKIGFICLHDEQSTYDLNFLNAANSVQAALGLTNEQVIIKTNIPEGNECYEAAKDLVNQGCNIVFANSFGHEDFMIKAAKEFPEVEFCHATGTKAHTEGLKNYHNAFASIYQGRYLAGIVAGMKLNEMIEAGKITADQAKMGYVGAFTYAEVMSGYTSFYLGAKSVCPSVTMEVQFTGSWYDPTEEKNAAEALINNKCVLISQHADSMGAPSACETAGVPNVSYNGSTYESCPETFLVSSAINWAPYFNYIIAQVNKGETIDADWCGGIEQGSVVLTGLNQDVIAEGTLAKVEEAITGFRAGTIKVFDTKNFTVDGKALTTYMADVDTDAAYEKDTEAITDGYFNESADRSAPYFDVKIDGIKLLNEKF
ncbi:MAG: BMP family ABC transporter substrate-binding protein [Ruminococcaceae bacterium]|nr:BMP family ABC transporter substrate-binding protein [Oscillospiraceae bacterium]